MEQLTPSQDELRNRIIQALEEQGFVINPHINLPDYNKITYRQIQQKAKAKWLSLHKKFLINSIEKIRNYCRNGNEIDPKRISLELREIHAGSLEEILFRWWNLIWWSIPYQHPCGRQMRFLIWDKTHNSPFGLICLQSPVLKVSVRDNALGIPKDELDVWVNKSMNAQRVGALPPYNELLGGKMVALALTSNEVREAYERKYANYTTIIKGRKLVPELLFITTTSAFGKSSLYNRLKYNNEVVAEFLGYTKGAGTFHIPQELYKEIINFLLHKGVNVSELNRRPMRNIRILSLGFYYLGLPRFEYHGIKRGFYLFPLVKNLSSVIKQKEKPIWHDRPFDKLVDYWKERWAIPRAERITKWKDFSIDNFFIELESILGGKICITNLLPLGI